MALIKRLTRKLLLPLWVLLLAVPAVFAFALTALFFAWAAAGLRGEEVFVGRALLLGTLCGLVAWLFVAVFHVGRETLVLTFGSGLIFRERFRKEMEELGYRCTGADGEADAAWYTPDFTAFVLGGGCRVRWANGEVAVTGPRFILEVLRERLRMHRHVGKVRQAVADTWVRQGRNLLKRVEVSLRVTPEQWEDVAEDVLGVLAHDGAQVVCDVHVLAQSDQGIVKETVDLVVRDRLRQKGISAEIRQEPLRRTGEVPVVRLPEAVPAESNACGGPV